MWDMSTRDCVHCFTDEGCLLGTKLSVSPSGSYVACGSDSGVVNVYGRDQCLAVDGEPPPSLSSNPKPLKSIMNLTTTIDQVCFNSTRCIHVYILFASELKLIIIHVHAHTLYNAFLCCFTCDISLNYFIFFATCSEILAIASQRKKDALKLVSLSHDVIS